MMLRNIFYELADTDQSACRALGRSRELAPGQILYREGEPFTGSLFLLDAGEMSLRDASGLLRVLAPGYLLGLSSYFTGAPYSATAFARAASTVLEIQASDLRALERARPAIADALNRMITASLGKRRAGLAVETSAVSRPVASIMSTPVLSCPTTHPLREVVGRMLAANVGSIVIDDEPPRAVTYRSAARVLSTTTPAGPDAVAADAAEPLVVAEPGVPAWKVQAMLRQTSSRHVLVCRGSERKGVVSLSDLAALAQGSLASLALDIEGATDLECLHEHYKGLHRTAARLLDTNRYASNAIAGLSEVHLAIQQRCIELTMEQLLDSGAGRPPCPFALIIMGSGGRREMMLDPDQDNALVLADEAGNAEHALEWFAGFADALNVNLDRCGYSLCEGDIMARSPRFRKTLSQWKAQVDHVATHPTDKAARWASIMFDFSYQHGETSLSDALRDHVRETMRDRPRLLSVMVDDDTQGRAPLGWFNRLIATGERAGKKIVDVKRNGLRMISNGARILALSHGVGASSTVDRLRGLTRIGVLSRDFSTTIEDAFDDLLAIVIAHQIEQRQLSITLDKEVAPQDLSSSRRESLRVAMRAVNRFQDFVQGRVEPG